MILHFSSLSGAAASAAMANHVWQSTLFAIVATLLSLALRKNQARIRYRLLLAGSLKFLIPFSLLVSVGNYVAVIHPALRWPGRWFAAVRAAGQPFTLYVTTAAHPGKSPLPFAMAAAVVWLCGSALVLTRWSLDWRRVYAAKGKATAPWLGRELQALRQLEQSAGVRRPIGLLVSPETLEPGVFGMGRPVLLWPAAISPQLSDEHLQAILAHEVAHVLRRDNLSAALHMAVEAIFWFHPLVWWLGARMVEERERACDEAVLAQGHSAQSYAESILKTCEFCIASPLACISGVTGADLKKRVVQIMTPHVAEKLSSIRKVILASLGFAAVAVPILAGVLNSPLMTAQTRSANSQPEAAPHIYNVGGDVSAPKLISWRDPEFSEAAKRAQYQGVCVLRLVVDTDGKPQHVQVVRHLKYGLDEKAIEAVSQYRFDPAMLHGQPVNVTVNIEVNFRLY